MFDRWPGERRSTTERRLAPSQAWVKVLPDHDRPPMPGLL